MSMIRFNGANLQEKWAKFSVGKQGVFVFYLFSFFFFLFSFSFFFFRIVFFCLKSLPCRKQCHRCSQRKTKDQVHMIPPKFALLSFFFENLFLNHCLSFLFVFNFPFLFVLVFSLFNF